MVWRFCVTTLVFVLSDAAEVPLGCFLYGWKISDAIWGTPNPVNATDALQCQQICANTPDCETFGFQPTWKDCWLGSKMQVPTRSSDISFVAGPAECQVAGKFRSGLSASPACALSPSPNFPGSTALQSADEFADGFVPVPLQCWPHWQSGKPALCKGLPVETLEDTATGWPGKCLGLHRTQLPVTEDCESSCRGNVSCASFQVVRTDGGLLECWQGTGYDCFRDAEVNVVQAKRFMHGHYRVLKDLRGYEVTGLQYAFSGSFFSDVNEAVKMCNHTCLSNIGCHAWRFSTGDGCWFDDPLRGSLTYPPDSKTMVADTEAAALVVAGEYIQRLCEVPQDLTPRRTWTTTILPKVLPLPEVALPNMSDLPAMPFVLTETVAPLLSTFSPNASISNISAAAAAAESAANAATAAAATAAAAAAAAGVAAMTPAPEVTPMKPVTTMPMVTPAPAAPAAPVTAAAAPVATLAPVAAVAAVAAPSTTRIRGAQVSDQTAHRESRFYQLSSGQIFYKDENLVLHRVNGKCQDQDCLSAECSNALTISETISNAQALGEDFNCGLVSSGGSAGFNWPALLISILLLICCCSTCSFFGAPNWIVKKCPWAEQYLPSQLFSEARHTPFTKLQEGRTYRGVHSLVEEDQLPLMYPGGPQFARAGLPPMAASMPPMGGLPPTQHLSPQMQTPENLWGSQPMYPGPLPPVDAGYDLVTVTPTGIEVTPLGEAPLPAGVPIVNPSFPMPVQYT